jgi:hypothetical protein
MSGQVMMIRGLQSAAEGFRSLPPALSCELARPRECSEKSFNEALLRFRAVLLALAAPRGRRVSSLQEAASGLGVSGRTLYAWRYAYLVYGFSGLVRRSRSDRGRTKSISVNELTLIVSAVPRLRAQGNIKREWRASRLQCSYSSYKRWVRLVKNRLNFTKFPLREGQNGSSL